MALRPMDPAIALADVPAVVLEIAEQRCVHLSHAAGPHHPAFISTKKRYERRGWTVRTDFPRWPSPSAPPGR